MKQRQSLFPFGSHTRGAPTALEEVIRGIRILITNDTLVRGLKGRRFRGTPPTNGSRVEVSQHGCLWETIQRIS